MNGRFVDWLTKEQASKVIGVSTKTVEKLAKDGKLQQRMIPQQGKPAIAAYNPTDVEKVRRERNPDGPEVYVMPTAAEDAQELLRVGSAQAAFGPTVATSTRLLLAEPPSSQKRKYSIAELRHKLFLTRKEAAVYSGLPPGYLRKLVEEGKIVEVVVSGNGAKRVATRIRRRDLVKL